MGSVQWYGNLKEESSICFQQLGRAEIGKPRITVMQLCKVSLQVKVRRRGSDTKFIAKVLAQGPECDIGEHPRQAILLA